MSAAPAAGFRSSRPARREPASSSAATSTATSSSRPVAGGCGCRSRGCEKTVLVVGSPGSGKTETLLRLAYGAAAASDWCVFVLDAKGDQRTQQRFAALMRPGRARAAAVPERALRRLARRRSRDRQPARAADRLGRRGRRHLLPRPLSQPRPRSPAPPPTGRPRSSAELLARLDRRPAHRPLGRHRARAQALAAFKAEQVDACRQRYPSFFDAIDGQLDGDWAFEDTDCGYLLLNELALRRGDRQSSRGS